MNTQMVNLEEEKTVFAAEVSRTFRVGTCTNCNASTADNENKYGMQSDGAIQQYG